MRDYADGGDTEACRLLGLYLYEGDEVSQDSKEALKYFSKAEEKGDALSAYYMGLCYYYGQGINASDDRAHGLFEKAAASGVEKAKKALEALPFPEHGLMTRGRAGDRDACSRLAYSFRERSYEYSDWLEGYRLQKKWYEVAAEYDDPQALLGLAHIYGNGWYVKWDDIKDEAKSREYYLKAYERAKELVKADENNAYAKYWLGMCLVFGWGCEKDEEKGKELIGQAERAGYSSKQQADGSSPEAQFKLGEDCRSAAENAEWQVRRGVETEKNTAEARENYNKAFDHFKRAVEGEFVYARYDLAKFYFEGKTVDKDYAGALKILLPLSGCTHGNRRHIWKGAAAARMIGDIYSNGGYGVERDDSKAFNWYLSAAMRDNPRACTKVGNAYFYGIGTKTDYASAAFWFEQAVFDYDEQMFYGSEKGYDYEANVGLGDCYRLGLGVKKDEDEAFHLYDDVSKYTNDCPAADERVARCYYFGIGVERDEGQALGFWETAAKYGDKDAIEALKKYFK